MSEAAEQVEQRVRWSELFIDLVWVFGATQLSAVLAHGHGFPDIGRTLLLLLPMWWGWVGVTVFGNAAGTRIDTAQVRLVLFGVAGSALAMAVAIPTAYAAGSLLFASGYTVLRLILWAAMRPLRFYGTGWMDPFAVALFVSAPLFLVGALLGGGGQVVLWLLATLVEIATPWLLSEKLKELVFETAHLPERFGLFMLIMLGETIVAAGGSASGHGDLSLGVLGVLGLGFLLTVALWWTYFHYGASAARHALRTTSLQARIVREVFSYAHLMYVVGLVCVAVGLEKVLAHPSGTPHSVLEMLLAPGVGLYLLGFCYSRWRMFGAPTWFRTSAVLVCVAIVVAAPRLPLVATAALVTAVLIVLNGLEYFWVETGRPLLLVPMPGSK
ncbi:MAG TPA: low temperature requirement protein A [Micromonosporaceae bacterium]|jgi:low temperature requirement protein LtrA|nr:low temperature requirement protein A [Micromonosporaceae bacterium]